MPETSKRTETERGRGGAEGQPDEAARAGAGEATAAEPLDERVLTALHAAADKKAVGLVVLDLRAVASFTDFFVIASGTNVRQVQAVADEVVERVRKEHRAKPARVEGYNTAEWVLLDYGDFILHVFEEKARRFYDLERLWRDAARVPLPEELADAGPPPGGAAGS
ncbi:MAG TPA: ribosome silencing factor, partial [Pyrinomonadaceae bacterium]|nr:ribosome silencing factor [Pyrinomonadaceae bacterium]